MFQVIITGHKTMPRGEYVYDMASGAVSTEAEAIEQAQEYVWHCGSKFFDLNKVSFRILTANKVNVSINGGLTYRTLTQDPEAAMDEAITAFFRQWNRFVDECHLELHDAEAREGTVFSGDGKSLLNTVF
jgi:hypothetical protein